MKYALTIKTILERSPQKKKDLKANNNTNKTTEKSGRAIKYIEISYFRW